ncbi:Homeobox protein knotted-1-like 3 [Hibiscus syriacus]|uniref:Homeobox protein knotted-1-like 3 n=1 Tax=Hibiscus syriacus TaxID=106335 RepID=A0A6A2WT43_HIBSY|nr:Homeobox protein knotted-1-like 3 [Hibiscus syriacus]
MTNYQEKPIFMKAELDVDQVEYEDEVWGKGCSCFSLFCFKRRRFNDDDESDSLLHRRGEEQTETWWKPKLNKLKQVSEKVAGPKWKNFIRKMSGYCHQRKCQKNRFQYDACSYALNFDNGADKGDDLLRNFSSRFAAPFEDDRHRTRPGL